MLFAPGRMNYVEQAVLKAGSLKALASILRVDYQQVQYWRARGYVSSYRGTVKLADYLGAPFKDIMFERALAVAHIKPVPDSNSTRKE